MCKYILHGCLVKLLSASSSISVPLEPEPQLQNVVVELALESMLPGVLPFPVHYLESNVLQRRKGGRGN